MSPQHVGRTGVAGAFGPDVLPGRHPDEQDGERDGAEQVGHADERGGCGIDRIRRIHGIHGIHAPTCCCGSASAKVRKGVWAAPDGPSRLS